MSTSLLAIAIMVAAPTPERLPAEVDDAYSLRFNPAGLGRMPGGELRLFGGRDRPTPDPDADYGLGAYAALKIFEQATFGIGFEADFENNDQFDDQGNVIPTDEIQRQFLTGFGFGNGPISAGFSWTYRWPFDRDDGGFWSLGVQVRPTNWLALGFNTRDVGQQVIDRQYDTGLAIRPWSRLLLGARWRYEEGDELDADSVDLAFRGQVEPIDGVVVGAIGDLDGRFQIQLSLNLERASAGGQIDVDTDGEIGFTAELVVRGYRKPSLIPVRRVAVLELAGELKPEPSFSLLGGGIRVPAYGQLPMYLERLRQDDEVAGVFARIGPLDVGWATVFEVRGAMKALRDAGRRVDCQLTGSDDKAFFIASVCSSVVIPPPMQIALNGVQAKLLFLGEAFDRYGIEAEVYRREEYKTGPDTYTRASMSAEQRESLGAYIDQVQSILVDKVAEGRQLSSEDMQKILARGVVSSTEAVALKLVDKVLYPDQVEDYIKEQYSGRVFLASGKEALQPERPRYRSPPTIAVINIDAPITAGQSVNLPFGLGRSVGADTVIESLEKARRWPWVRAVVLRVDSPGGSAFAADVIARAVRRVAEVKPVIASFGDVAASGGYYVASGASVIYAEPTTLTGSIGVFSVRFSLETLLRRIGVYGERLGPGIGSPTFYLSSTPEERKIAQKSVNAAYQQFLRSVAEGRKMPVEKIAEVAKGRVWTGADAKARGLVDELGGLVDALRRARQEAGMSEDAEVKVVEWPDNVTSLPMSDLLASMVGLAELPQAPVQIWPEELVRLFGPILAVEPARAGAPEPMAWLPLGLSVD